MARRAVYEACDETYRDQDIRLLISTLSVALLAMVSWKAASENGWLMAALLAGTASSIVGMLLRWISYRIEEKQEGKG